MSPGFEAKMKAAARVARKGALKVQRAKELAHEVAAMKIKLESCNQEMAQIVADRDSLREKLKAAKCREERLHEKLRAVGHRDAYWTRLTLKRSSSTSSKGGDCASFVLRRIFDVESNADVAMWNEFDDKSSIEARINTRVPAADFIGLFRARCCNNGSPAVLAAMDCASGFSSTAAIHFLAAIESSGRQCAFIECDLYDVDEYQKGVFVFACAGKAFREFRAGILNCEDAARHIKYALSQTMGAPDEQAWLVSFARRSSKQV
eukprot:g1755.t1